MSVGRHALRELADSLREERGLLSPHVAVVEELDGGAAAFAELVAAGPRTRGREDRYALVIEAVREGWLLHYGRPRILVDLDPDLALLAGDYLYALGLDALAELGDAPAVALLGDLISLAALCVSEGLEASLDPLWLATTVAVGCGEGPEIAAAKRALNGRETASDRGLWRAAQITAENSGISRELLVAAKAIDFPAVNESNLG